MLRLGDDVTRGSARVRHDGRPLESQRTHPPHRWRGRPLAGVRVAGAQGHRRLRLKGPHGGASPRHPQARHR
jgi:hypothetical protein